MTETSISQSDVDHLDGLRKAAMLAADGAALSALLHDDLIFVHAAGQWEDKPKHIDAIASQRVKYLKWDQTDIRSAPLGSNAWLKNGRVDFIVEFGGNEVALSIVFSAVWILDGELKLISWQSTPWPK